jgi:hypothetical protein
MNHRITALLATAAALTFSAGAALAEDQAPAPATPAPAAAAPAAAAPAAPMPPSLNPAMTAPLAQNPMPMSVDLGPLGNKVYITGVVSGLAFAESNHVPVYEKQSGTADLSNAQIFINKVDGQFQYFIDVGAYSLPTLSVPYLKATSQTNTYDVMPLAFIKIAPNATPGFSIQAGKLPTLIGSEYMFTFENSNIERGLVWNVEPLVSRGVQANYTSGPMTFNLAFTDGYYSNVYNTLSGAFTYVISPSDTVIVQGEGPTSKTSRPGLNGQLFNNTTLFDLIWTHTMGPWSFTPYFQYTTSPAYKPSGTTQDTTTWSVALLGTYTFDSKSMLAGVSLPARFEYISQNDGKGVASVLAGPGSNAWTVTFTPTYTFGHYFVRGEVSYVGLGHNSFGFGENLNKDDQVRGMLELGVLF